MFRSIADDVMSIIRLISNTENVISDDDELDETQRRRALSVDGYKERSECQLFTDIIIKDYKKLAQRICTRYNLPNDIRQALILNAKNDSKLIKDFQFRFGQNGHQAYGVVATQKYKKTFDFALSIYYLEMHVSGGEDSKNRKMMASSNSSGADSKNRKALTSSKMTPLDDHLNADWLNHYQRKALEAFDREYPGVTILRK